MDSDFKIIDNFLEINTFNKILNIFISGDCPYYIRHNIVDNDSIAQLEHVIFYNKVNSQLYETVKPIIDKLKPSKLNRIKVNLLLKSETIREHGLHVDDLNWNKKSHTSIFYLNTNNGYTRFKSGEKVESVANRLVTFHASKKHGGSTNSCDTPYRLVLNINYEI